jgi:hypothetical protein
MSLRTRLGIESGEMVAALFFYVIVGIVFLASLPLTDFAPHLGIIGIFSLVTAYGTLKKRSWTIWPVIILLFAGTTFSLYTLYFSLPSNYILGLGTIVYLVLTWVFTGYLFSKRRSLET